MNVNALKIWNEALKELQEQLRGSVPEGQLKHVWSWFEPLKPLILRNNVLTIGVPSKRFSEIFADKYMPHLLPILRRGLGEALTADFTVVEAETGQAGQASVTPNKSTQETPAEQFESHLSAEYTFKNFVKGLSNKAALNVAKAIAKRPEQTTFNPLFLYGPSGVGKTHLVTAIGHGVKENFPDKRVLFVSANLFKTQYVDAYKENATNDFMHFYQSVDVLIIDDIQELNSERSQRTFFHIFNHLQLNGRQIIITCDRPPVLFEGIEERMLTRFKWGMVLEMERPDLALRHDIINARIRRDGLNKDGLQFPKDVVAYIAENVTDNVRDLQGVVTSIIAYSIVDDCEVDLALAERVVARIVNLARQEITLSDIMKAVCRMHKVKARDIESKSRKAEIVQARQIVMYLTQKHTGMNLSQIGLELGRRDHATVLHGIRQVEKRIATDHDYRKHIEEIETSVKKN